MSTLRPDATNFVGTDESNISVRTEDPRLHISTGTTTGGSSEPIALEKRTHRTPGSITQHKRARPTILPSNDVPRHRASSRGRDEDNQLFRFDQNDEPSEHILSKRRRISALSPQQGDCADGAASIATVPSVMPRTSITPLQDNLLPNLSHEHIHVEFADSESMHFGGSENRGPAPAKRRRDHRILVRNVVGELLHTPETYDCGEIWVGDSDEESAK